MRVGFDKEAHRFYFKYKKGKKESKKLTAQERVEELAQMLGGKKLSESAIAHANQLLN